MTKYREILRLKSLGFSEKNIAQSCGVSRNTVAKVLKKAAEINLSWPLDFDMTDSALEELMFPKDKSATNKRMPNFDYIRKELLRNGVNKKLLWVEYCEECRMSSEEPLMYSQFCYYMFWMMILQEIPLERMVARILSKSSGKATFGHSSIMQCTGIRSLPPYFRSTT